MNNIKYNLHLGEMESYTKIIVEAAKGIVQIDMKGFTKYCSLFGSWLSSKK